MSDNILDHIMEQNEKYRNIIKEVRTHISGIPLFSSEEDINMSRDSVLRKISELLDENGF